MSKRENRVALVLVSGLIVGTFAHYWMELGSALPIVIGVILVPLLTAWRLTDRRKAISLESQ